MVDPHWKTDILDRLLDPDPGSRFGEDELDRQVIVFAADTDRTQAYVFESDKLPEIRGASRQLTELNERAAVERRLGDSLDKHSLPARWAQDCVLYAGGGSVLAILPDETRLVEDFAQALECAYPEKTGAATISTTWRRFSVRQVCQGLGMGQRRFGDAILVMGTKLRRAKQERERVPFVERLPFVRVCASCQSRPAAAFDYTDPDIPGDLGKAICTICQNKLLVGRDRSYWLEKLLDDIQTERANQQCPRFANAEHPQDIEEMAGNDDIALIYADGDGIGEKLQRITSPLAYRKFSAELQQITQKAVVVALAEHALPPHECERIDPKTRKRVKVMVHRWEVITIGGDDVLMIVPAPSVLRIAATLARYFHEHGQELGQYLISQQDSRPFGMSVGFAIGKPKTPVRLLRDAAYKALKNAKKRARKANLPCIDFHNFVKEGMMGEDLAEWRKDTKSAASGGAMLTSRPYTSDEIDRLAKSVRLLKDEGFPSSQLYHICAELGRGEVRGSLFYFYQRARLSDKHQEAPQELSDKHQEAPQELSDKHQKALQELERIWREPSSDRWPWLSQTSDGLPTRTVLLDIVDLLEYETQDQRHD